MKRFGVKLLSLVLIVVLAALFAGCKSSSKKKQKETEAPTAAVTEAQTEAETEAETEPETEPETEAETEEEPETEAETEAERASCKIDRSYALNDATLEIVSIEEAGEDVVEDKGEPLGKWVNLHINISDGKILYQDFEQTVAPAITVDGNYHSGITFPVSSFEFGEDNTIYCKGEATMLFDVSADTPLEDLDISVNV